MSNLGDKIARKRKDLGLTQTEFAEQLSVTRQTVSRWESNSVMPDIDKIPDIAELLGVTCDYLLNDRLEEEETPFPSGIMSRLLESAKDRDIRLNFFDDEADIDLYNTVCRIVDFEGGWVKISAETKKGKIEKLIPIATILSIEFV